MSAIAGGDGEKGGEGGEIELSSFGMQIKVHNLLISICAFGASLRSLMARGFSRRPFSISGPGEKRSFLTKGLRAKRRKCLGIRWAANPKRSLAKKKKIQDREEGEGRPKEEEEEKKKQFPQLYSFLLRGWERDQSFPPSPLHPKKKCSVVRNSKIYYTVEGGGRGKLALSAIYWSTDFCIPPFPVAVPSP